MMHQPVQSAEYLPSVKDAQLGDTCFVIEENKLYCLMTFNMIAYGELHGWKVIGLHGLTPEQQASLAGVWDPIARARVLTKPTRLGLLLEDDETT